MTDPYDERRRRFFEQARATIDQIGADVSQFKAEDRAEQERAFDARCRAHLASQHPDEYRRLRAAHEQELAEAQRRALGL